MKTTSVKKPVKAEDMFIDMGATSREDAQMLGVRAGTPITSDIEFRSLGKDMVTGKALDDRGGCSMLIEVLRQMEKVAREFITELNIAKNHGAPIVTELTPFKAFYPAEEYHQEYLRRNPDQMYCRAVISPKLAKFRRQYFAKLRKV